MPRTYKQKKEAIIAARNKLGKDKPILLGQFSRIRPSTIIEVAKRWKERRGITIRSVDKPIEKYTFNGKDVALRLATQEIIKPLKRLNLNKENLKTIEKILQNRKQKAKNSNFDIRLPRDLLIMKLVNSVGESKAKKILEIIAKRSIDIQKAANSEKIRSHSKSDAFSNIGPDISSVQMLFEFDMEDKKEFVNRVQDQLHQIHKQRNEAQKIHDLKRKKNILRLLNSQLKEGTLELTKYKIHHGIF